MTAVREAARAEHAYVVLDGAVLSMSTNAWFP
jgi:hypothetical protein